MSKNQVKDAVKALFSIREQSVKSTTINEKGQFGIVETSFGSTIGFVTNPESKKGTIRIVAFEPANIEIAKHCRDVLDEHIRNLEEKSICKSAR